MNFAHFFIDRPRFAAVISIVIMIVGGISYFTLPVAQYPDVAPPTVVVRANLPGATPAVLADTIAAPLEQEINGVENMLYITSQSTNDGAVQITVTFELGTDLDTAQVLVQNRVAIAEPRLPEQTRRIGVTVSKSVPDILMVVQMFSPDSTFDLKYVSNYMILQVREQIRRINGVGDARIFGSREYSMRVWLDPGKLANLSLEANDVVNALREQNIQVAAGVIGQPPDNGGAAFQFNISTLGRLNDVSEFEDIVVKEDEDGRIVKLRDIARVELGALNYGVNNYLNETPAVALPIFQRPGSNALETAQAIRNAMEDLSKSFPKGLEYAIIYDPTIFIEESIDAVIQTIFEAIILVVIVIIIFLQSWRAAIIPLVAIPISLIGTFAAMAAFDFSLNNLSLFGLVLAIGIVVDDAIVVVENIERNLALGLKPRDASRKAMNEITGAIVATTLVMIAIFVPTAFLPGISGQFYRQFALTIAAAVTLSSVVSLTLSPALGKILLQPTGAQPDILQRTLNLLFGWLFSGFNWVFERSLNGYSWIVQRLVRIAAVALVILVGLLFVTGLGFRSVPGGFVPPLDKGYGIIVLQLPESASVERTDTLVQDVVKKALEVEGIENVVAFAGFNGATFANSPNAAALFPVFAPFEERIKKGLTGDHILNQLRGKLSGVREAFAIVIPPPPVSGVGSGGGFKMMIQDKANLGYEALESSAFSMMMSAGNEAGLTQVFTPFRANTPQLYADINRTKAKMLNVPLNSIFDTLQTNLGSLFVNELNLYGRTYRVTAQAEGPFRDEISDIGQLEVKSRRGEMVPLSTLVDMQMRGGPDRVLRYNLYPAADIQGDTTPGFSTGQSLDTMEQLAETNLPPGMDFEWTELAYQQSQVGNIAIYIFALAVVFVFLVLVAQYENWSMPIAIIMIVPLCLTGAIWLIWFRDMSNNILTQIGFVVLIGLAAKNAILIIEFARQREDEGADRFEAASSAAKIRLRPILMTSFAFILGVVPLMLASGAGWEMRQSLGTAVFGGMLGVTLFGIFLTPAFYVLIRALGKNRQ